MFSGYGGFERFMQFVATFMTFGFLFFLYYIFDGSSESHTYEEPSEDSDRALIEAIQETRDLQEIEQIILDEPWRVERERQQGWHPLHVATAGVAQGYFDLELLELLLDHGADINGRIEPGWDRHLATTLHIAVPYSNVTLVRFLIEQGGDVTARNISRQTPIDLADRLRNENIRQEMKELLTSHQYH